MSSNVHEKYGAQLLVQPVLPALNNFIRYIQLADSVNLKLEHIQTACPAGHVISSRDDGFKLTDHVVELLVY